MSDRHAAAMAVYNRPLDSTETPPGQRYAIGDRVRCIVDTYGPWGFKRGDLADIEYSYQQKYGWMTGDDERNRRMYSVRFMDGRNALAWVYEHEIEPETETPSTNCCPEK